MMIIFVIMLFLAGMYLNFSFSRNSNVGYNFEPDCAIV